jgi:hypothetical protein
MLLYPLGSSQGIGNATLNPLITSPAVILLAAAGAVAFRRSGTSAVAALAISYPLFALSVVGIQQGVIATLRLQTSYQWTAVVLAGAGFAWAAGKFMKRKWRYLAPALLALAAVSYLPYRPFVHRLYATQMEYNFLKKALPAIPDGCTVVRLDRQVDKIDTDLPTWITTEAGKDVRFIEISRFLGRTHAGVESCHVFYRGLTCFSFSPDTEGPAEQPLCARMDVFPHVDLAGRVIPPERAEHIVFRVKEIPLAMRRILPDADPGGP